jgi:putative ABC transport system permease protein
MFRNYITVAFRNLGNDKVFSLINILGLALGISATLEIYLIVHHEYSFDRFQKNGNRVYRVVSEMHFPDQLAIALLTLSI